jgi:hypothetical protein
VSRPLKNRPYQRHGLNALKTALASTQRESQQNLVDSLGETGRALREWRDAIIADLGGEDAISAQERAVIDAATTTYLMLSSVDRFLLEQPSIVNKSRRQLFPVVLERQRLADALVRYLETLGLRRRVQEPLDLDGYLAARSRREVSSDAEDVDGDLAASEPEATVLS